MSNINCGDLVKTTCGSNESGLVIVSDSNNTMHTIFWPDGRLEDIPESSIELDGRNSDSTYKDKVTHFFVSQCSNHNMFTNTNKLSDFDIGDDVFESVNFKLNSYKPLSTSSLKGTVILPDPRFNTVTVSFGNVIKDLFPEDLIPIKLHPFNLNKKPFSFNTHPFNLYGRPSFANDILFDLNINIPPFMEDTCECGAEKCKLPIHSDWCPKYEEYHA